MYCTAKESERSLLSENSGRIFNDFCRRFSPGGQSPDPDPKHCKVHLKWKKVYARNIIDVDVIYVLRNIEFSGPIIIYERKEV